MRALVCERAGEVALRDVPAPVPGPGEVVVRVEAALTCGTDLKLIRRGHPKFPFPVVVGHEFAGLVDAADPATGFAPGERVTAVISGPCGACDDCAAGRENLCPTAFDTPLWGAFAGKVRVPARVVARGLYRVPEGLAPHAAALLDPLASVVHALGRVPDPSGETVAVLGTGPISLLFTALLLQRGARDVLVVGRRPHRIGAHRALGARTLVCDPVRLVAEARAALGGRGAALVVDTTGDSGVAAGCVDLVRRGGAALLFAGLPREVLLPVSAYRVHYEEVTLVGSFHYTPRDVRASLDLLAAGVVPVAAVVTGEAPLDAWEGVFASLARGEGMKTALVP